MNIIKAPIFLAFLLVFGLISPALGASVDLDDERYFVQTTKGFWRNTFGARHAFRDGFTADLSEWQLRVAKLSGLKVTPVNKLNILPAQTEVAAIGDQEILGRVRPTLAPSPRMFPTEQVPWGIRTVYNDIVLDRTGGGASVSVAILDTGVFKDHPDLKNRVKQCKDFTSAKLPVVNGKCEDKNGHGTHVAGIVAADGGSDGLGIYGVAPQADLFAYKVCGANGSCWSDDIAAAIRHAADNGAQVVNLSLGSDIETPLIFEAVEYAAEKGTLIVAASGNDGPYPGSIDYPAAFSAVVAVGALDFSWNVSDWSSRGINSTTTPFVVEDQDIELAGPGVNIESTWKDGAYVILSGTSMASPHVAGLAAKLWQFQSLNPAAQTRLLLQTSAHDLDLAGDDDASGFGLPTL